MENTQTKMDAKTKYSKKDIKIFHVNVVCNYITPQFIDLLINQRVTCVMRSNKLF